MIKYPEWQNQVVLIQITTPLDSKITNENQISYEITSLIAQINGEFGSLDYIPIHHFHKHLKQEDLYSMLSIADICCICSTRDSINTVPLEYVICQKLNYGVLILSEFSATSEILYGAISVNPWDINVTTI